jgi:hypothetical protein
MYLLTLTAPGVGEHDQWDPGHVRGSRPRCGCHEGLNLGRWNAGASKSWNRLRTALRRTHDLEYLRAVEVQKRGALHLHVIVWSPDPLDVLAVQALAMAAGFGCVLDLAPIVPGSKRHAYYVAKYVTKACDSRDDVPWTVDTVDEDTGEARQLHTVATYRAWSSSQEWGLTMKAIKAVCSAAARRAAEARRALENPANSVATAADGPSSAPGGPEPPG